MNYWAIYKAVVNILAKYQLIGTDAFIGECVRRVQEDADPQDWNDDDAMIAVRNTLNELIEKNFHNNATLGADSTHIK